MSSMPEHAWRMWGKSLPCWCLSDMAQIDAWRNHVPNLCQPANNIGMEDLVALPVPREGVVGIACQASNGPYQLSEHDIPHLGSQSLARELDVIHVCLPQGKSSALFPCAHAIQLAAFPQGLQSVLRKRHCEGQSARRRQCPSTNEAKLSQRHPRHAEIHKAHAEVDPVRRNSPQSVVHLPSLEVGEKHIGLQAPWPMFLCWSSKSMIFVCIPT